MSHLGRPGENFPPDVLVGARFFLGRVVAVRSVGTCLLPLERFYCVAPFQSSRSSVGAFHFPPEGHCWLPPGAAVLPPSATYRLLTVCASVLALFASRLGWPRGFLPDWLADHRDCSSSSPSLLGQYRPHGGRQNVIAQDRLALATTMSSRADLLTVPRSVP